MRKGLKWLWKLNSSNLFRSNCELYESICEPWLMMSCLNWCIVINFYYSLIKYNTYQTKGFNLKALSSKELDNWVDKSFYRLTIMHAKLVKLLGSICWVGWVLESFYLFIYFILFYFFQIIWSHLEVQISDNKLYGFKEMTCLWLYEILDAEYVEWTCIKVIINLCTQLLIK